MTIRRTILIAALLLPGLAACQSIDLAASLQGASPTTTASTGGSGAAIDPSGRPKPGDEDIKLGKEHFRNANYGLAEKHFRAAVERAPDALEPVIGLAASYDQLGRFDMSDRLYTEAMRMSGGSATVLNNRGYSYYLRRDFKRARSDFQQALRKEPGNEMARRNMALLGR
jgi:Flp pilus assembly protein TadD